MNRLKVVPILLLLAAGLGYKAYQDNARAKEVIAKAKEAAEQEKARLVSVGDWPIRKRMYEYCLKDMKLRYNEMTKEVSKKTKSEKTYEKLDKTAHGCFVVSLGQPQELYHFKDSELLAKKMGELFRTYDKKTLGEILKSCGDWGCPRSLYPEPDVMAAAIKDYITELSANVEALDPILKDKLTEVDR